VAFWWASVFAPRVYEAWYLIHIITISVRQLLLKHTRVAAYLGVARKLYPKNYPPNCNQESDRPSLSRIAYDASQHEQSTHQGEYARIDRPRPVKFFRACFLPDFVKAQDGKEEEEIF
jgi:hypothetical protein